MSNSKDSKGKITSNKHVETRDEHCSPKAEGASTRNDAEQDTEGDNLEHMDRESASGKHLSKQTTRSRSYNDRHIVNQSETSAGASPERENKPRRRPGTLPKYDFTFRKVEEKIHAKEVEKMTLEAKAREKEEAEIKMLRKTLIFKANPVPSFCQEPPPPKPEIKKIPTTRPKSPKLGRKKTPATSDSDEHSCCSARTGRLSLDSNMVTNKQASTGTFPVHKKEPVWKSLPKPPSEKTSSAKENSPDND